MMEDTKHLVADEKARIARNSKSKYKTAVLTSDKFEDMQVFFPFFSSGQVYSGAWILRKI
jgi:hypothetical protein